MRNLFLCFFLLLSQHIFAQLESAFDLDTFEVTFPENYEARQEFKDTLFAPIEEVLESPSKIVAQKSVNGRVLYKIRETDHAVYQLILNEEDYKFPVYSKGSYILKRNRETGDYIQLKVFLQYENGCFLRIYPDGYRSSMDLFLFDQALYKNINIPLDFKQVLMLPLSRIIGLTQNTIKWEYFTGADYRETWKTLDEMTVKIESQLPELEDTEDGAIDEFGNFVFIETESLQQGTKGFNCSGFVKWIADGIYHAYKDRFLPISPLKEKQLDERGNDWSRRYEDMRDPYFGLDWSRNIAETLRPLGKSLDGPFDTDYLPEDTSDVTAAPFFPYRKNIGYRLTDLKQILYFLAQDEPGWFYLGSINREFQLENQPVLRQHTHVAAFFPYFDENGIFQLGVFERNVRSSVESLDSRYPGDYVHLVRIKGCSEFSTPEINY